MDIIAALARFVRAQARFTEHASESKIEYQAVDNSAAGQDPSCPNTGDNSGHNTGHASGESTFNQR